MKIAIVDYGAGNIQNVVKAIASTGLDTVVTKDPTEISQADGLVVPGVGAFARAMDKLADAGLVKVIQDFAKTGKPILGLCLGMQLLFDSSSEFGATKGLGLIPGQVVALPKQVDYKVPQMGWNQNQVSQDLPITEAISGQYTYFVHSYYAQTDPQYIAAWVDYGSVKVPSVVVKDNVMGAQFHPEKSGPVGLAMWQRFKEMVVGA
ncbi:imidazole glycerol phosphate synthase subunit HisH [Lactobacillaceae bacterium L1_55_11]|nr:imidazole glycerol phosphate synthase subunit HisH [Lactobacillaceae bacterium L1_55_11]